MVVKLVPWSLFRRYCQFYMFCSLQAHIWNEIQFHDNWNANSSTTKNSVPRPIRQCQVICKTNWSIKSFPVYALELCFLLSLSNLKIIIKISSFCFVGDSSTKSYSMHYYYYYYYFQSDSPTQYSTIYLFILIRQCSTISLKSYNFWWWSVIFGQARIIRHVFHN